MGWEDDEDELEHKYYNARRPNAADRADFVMDMISSPLSPWTSTSTTTIPGQISQSQGPWALNQGRRRRTPVVWAQDEDTTDDDAVDGQISPPFIPPDSVMATGGYDHTILLWDIRDGTLRKSIQYNFAQINALAISPDRVAVAAATYKELPIFDMCHGQGEQRRDNTAAAAPAGTGPIEQPLIKLTVASGNITSHGFFTRTRALMFTGGEDGTVRVWDIRLPVSPRNAINLQTIVKINTVTLHPNELELVFGDDGGRIHVWDFRMAEFNPMWDAREDEILHQLIPDPQLGGPLSSRTTSIQGLAIDSEGKTLAAINSRGTCYVWKIMGSGFGAGIRREVSGGGDAGTQGGAGSSPGRNLNQPKPLDKIQAHDNYGLSCTFSPDGSILATTSADESAKLWETTNENFSLKGSLYKSGQKWVWDGAFTGDGKFLLTGSSDGIPKLWDVGTGEVVRKFVGHTKIVTCVALSDQDL